MDQKLIDPIEVLKDNPLAVKILKKLANGDGLMQITFRMNVESCPQYGIEAEGLKDLLIDFALLREATQKILETWRLNREIATKMGEEARAKGITEETFNASIKASFKFETAIAEAAELLQKGEKD